LDLLLAATRKEGEQAPPQSALIATSARTTAQGRGGITADTQAATTFTPVNLGKGNLGLTRFLWPRLQKYTEQQFAAYFTWVVVLLTAYNIYSPLDNMAGSVRPNWYEPLIVPLLFFNPIPVIEAVSLQLEPFKITMPKQPPPAPKEVYKPYATLEGPPPAPKVNAPLPANGEKYTEEEVNNLSDEEARDALRRAGVVEDEKVGGEADEAKSVAPITYTNEQVNKMESEELKNAVRHIPNAGNTPAPPGPKPVEPVPPAGETLPISVEPNPATYSDEYPPPIDDPMVAKQPMIGSPLSFMKFWDQNGRMVTMILMFFLTLAFAN